MEVKDCSTWFLIEKQSKTPYPPLPRFSAHTILRGGFLEALERYRCWLLQRFHVGFSRACAMVRKKSGGS
jgi:hypothetical protein